MLSKIGEKVLDFLGEKQFDNCRSHYLSEISDFFTKYPKIADLFPYETFDEKYRLFFNSDSVGFVLETPTLVGASEEMQKEVDGLFQNTLPEGSSLQVILWADPYIEELCDQWKEMRKSDMMRNLAERRTAYLKQMAFHSPHSPYCLRNFRCFIAYSQKNLGTNPVILESIVQLQNQLKTTLEMLGLPVFAWGATELINTVSRILNMDINDLKPFQRRWDPEN